MKNQNINVGDKLLCKKYLNIGSSSHFNYGEYYIVSNIIIEYDLYCYIISEDNNYGYPFINSDYLYSHFYTKKEERKIKLNKLINEKTES